MMEKCTKLPRPWCEDPVERRNNYRRIDLALLDYSVREFPRWTLCINHISGIYQVIVRKVFSSKRSTEMFNLINQAFMNRYRIDIFTACT